MKSSYNEPLSQIHNSNKKPRNQDNDGIAKYCKELNK